MEILSAFIIGLVGSLHCIGMCGPIALALPSSQQNKFKFVLGRVLYNVGRIISYALMGAFFGLIGSKIALFGFQQTLSLAIGILLLLYVIIPKSLIHKLPRIKLVDNFTSVIKKSFTSLWRKDSLSSLLLIGILNGFLPCGLVYVAIAGAAATGTIQHGALFMILFGLGTLPMMTIIALLGNFITLQLRRRLTKLIPVFIALLAIIFILRGLNLGIKYISPKLSIKSAAVTQHDCCK